MIFDELSNADFRFVLRRLGAELDGARLDAPPPAADHGSFAVPARRGLTFALMGEAILTTLSFLRIAGKWPRRRFRHTF